MNKQELIKSPIVVYLSKNDMPKTIIERDVILERLQTNVEFKQLDESSEARECEFKPRKIDGFATAVISFVEDDTELVECNLCSYIMGKRRLKKYCSDCGAKIINRTDNGGK